MEVKGYSMASNLNTKKSRLGCSVCKKKIHHDTPIEHFSSKPCIDKKHIKHKLSDEKCENSEYIKLVPTVKLSSNIRDCYCHHMEEIKNESFPKLICSKRFKTQHLIDVDEKWLNEIIEFRRQNWFDCHNDSLINGLCVQNILPLNIFNEYKLNCNHLNNSLSLTSFDGMELRTKNPFICVEDTTAVKKHLNVQKKTAVSKFVGKKNPNAVYKPWIPPSSSSSIHYKF